MKAASARSARSTTPSNRGDFTRGHAIACPFWVKEEAPRSYAGWELCSFVADCINKAHWQRLAGFSRHQNEAAQALQREFHWQDDGISMTLSKQSESTKVGLLAHDEQAHEKKLEMLCSQKAGSSFKSVWLISNIFPVWSPPTHGNSPV